MANEIEQWLGEIDLAKYADIFKEHEVGLRDLPHLTDDDLKTLGLPLGPRRRLLAAWLSRLRPGRRMSPLHGNRPNAVN